MIKFITEQKLFITKLILFGILFYVVVYISAINIFNFLFPRERLGYDLSNHGLDEGGLLLRLMMVVTVFTITLPDYARILNTRKCSSRS